MNHFDHSTLRQVLCVVEARRSLELGMNSVSNCRVPFPKIAENIRSKEMGPLFKALTQYHRGQPSLSDDVGFEEEPNIRLHPL